MSGLALALALVGLAASASGAVSIPLSELPDLLWHAATPRTELWRNVLLDIRMPRVVFAFVAGAALAVSGAAMQALFRNPLAEPGLIGISAGGALGAVAAIVLTSGGFQLVAPAAFAGSLAATLCAYALGRRVPGVAGLLLAGIAINAVAGSMIGLITFVANDAQLRDITFWTMGSLAGANWRLLAFLGPWTLLMSLWLMRQWRVMNALLLGEREAQHLGYALRRVRAQLVLACALIVGPLVAATGGIGFVGLVVPHLVRMTLGANHRWLLPACVLAGALALTLADWLSRVAVVPAELPIGLVTSLVGGPFFLWLLARGGKQA
ncbi:FecCD family ABC transporter permease [Bordetella flabilis]|uniref:Iron ABC transporter n=1 Tax=Bordetella flabilis TaxID=463014 RepID=A0A193GM95_9BORD|nr:iron ABC transporter [Bordetella flabilis]